MSEFTYPKVQQLDSNGNPLKDSLMYFYEAGTSKLKAVFLDSGNTIQADNPATANEYGFFPQMFFSGQYRIVLKDKNGVTVDTDDPYGDLPSTGCAIPAPVVGYWTFYGRVFIDTNDNGVQDGGEVGLAGVTVRVHSDDLELIVTTVTDANGCYSISWAFAPYDWQPWVSIVMPAGYTYTLPAYAYYDASGMTLGTVRNYNFGIKLIPPPPPPSLAGLFVRLSDANANNDVIMNWVVTNPATHEGYASGAGVAAGYSLTREIGTFNGVPNVMHWVLVAGAGMRLRSCEIRMHDTNMVPTGVVTVEPGNPQAPTSLFYSDTYTVLTFGSAWNDYANLFQNSSPPLKFTLSVIGS